MAAADFQGGKLKNVEITITKQEKLKTSKSFLHTVEHKGFGQSNMARCWYAGYRMLLKYLNRNPDEVQSKLSAVLDFPDAYENGLFVADYRKAANVLGLEIVDAETRRIFVAPNRKPPLKSGASQP